MLRVVGASSCFRITVLSLSLYVAHSYMSPILSLSLTPVAGRRYRRLPFSLSLLFMSRVGRCRRRSRFVAVASCGFVAVAYCGFVAVTGCGSSISPVTVFAVIAFMSRVGRCRRSRFVAVEGCGFVAVAYCGFVAVTGCGSSISPVTVFVVVAFMSRVRRCRRSRGFVAVVGCQFRSRGYMFPGLVVAAGFKFVCIRRYHWWRDRRCDFADFSCQTAGLYHPDCITRTVSPGLYHPDCITRAVLPGLYHQGYHQGCITRTVSADLMHSLPINCVQPLY